MWVIKIIKAIIVHIATTEWGFSGARNLMVISVLTNNDPDFLDHIKFTGVYILKVNDVHEKFFHVPTQPQVQSMEDIKKQ